jgi:CubicO group peptidase (beta-lactamase class C family)
MSPTTPTMLVPLFDVKSPSIAVVICDRSSIVWQHAHGPVDSRSSAEVDIDTVFGIGAVTESLTAAAILALRDEGVLCLEEPLHRTVPEALALRYPTRDSPSITLYHLLTHTAGLPGSARQLEEALDRSPEEHELLDHLAALSLENVPGTKARPSLLDLALLGIVVQRRSGRSYRAFVEERILGPLGMTATTFEPDSLGAPLATPHGHRNGVLEPTPITTFGAYLPACGLFASAQDLARLLSFQLDAWPPRDDPESGLPLCRATVRESHQKGPHQRIAREGNGLGWAIGKHDVLGGEDDILGEIVHLHGKAPDQYAAFIGFIVKLGLGIAGVASASVALQVPLLRTLAEFADRNNLLEPQPR